MTRLVDADELHEIVNWSHEKPPYSKKKIHRLIDMTRTVDAEPVRHGKWMRTEDECGDFLCWTCSECGEQYVMPHHRASYCPNCGAKMEERKEE